MDLLQSLPDILRAHLLHAWWRSSAIFLCPDHLCLKLWHIADVTDSVHLRHFDHSLPNILLFNLHHLLNPLNMRHDHLLGDFACLGLGNNIELWQLHDVGDLDNLFRALYLHLATDMMYIVLHFHHRPFNDPFDHRHRHGNLNDLLLHLLNGLHNWTDNFSDCGPRDGLDHFLSGPLRYQHYIFFPMNFWDFNWLLHLFNLNTGDLLDNDVVMNLGNLNNDVSLLNLR
mmetsp:Transcript_51082/g.119579  ORF Transcript_51082/g.119579 Transcript_51082/m.119579 type:complete len:228 (+) Transcript_51082:636-1319(+)